MWRLQQILFLCLLMLFVYHLGVSQIPTSYQKSFSLKDTSKFALAIITSKVAYLKVQPPPNSKDSLSILQEGELIKVLSYVANDTWIVKRTNTVGFLDDKMFRFLTDREIERLSTKRDVGSKRNHAKLMSFFNIVKTDKPTWGVSIGYGSNKAFQSDVFYHVKASRFHFGFSHQINGQKGSPKTQQLTNYGKSVIGRGTYFTTFDLKYSIVTESQFSISIDGNIGTKKNYTNYSDQRFKNGGYYLITNRSPIAGIGGNIGYVWKNGFELTAGYNTIKGVNMDFRLTFTNIFYDN